MTGDGSVIPVRVGTLSRLGRAGGKDEELAFLLGDGFDGRVMLDIHNAGCLVA